METFINLLLELSCKSLLGVEFFPLRTASLPSKTVLGVVYFFLLAYTDKPNQH